MQTWLFKNISKYIIINKKSTARMMFNSNRFTCISSIASIFLFFNIHFQDWTLLHTASIFGYANIVSLLLLLGAGMDIVNTNVRTSTVFFFHICKLFIQSTCLLYLYVQDDIHEKNHKNITWITFILVLSLYK